jgi:hypothetical protein
MISYNIIDQKYFIKAMVTLDDIQKMVIKNESYIKVPIYTSEGFIDESTSITCAKEIFKNLLENFPEENVWYTLSKNCIFRCLEIIEHISTDPNKSKELFESLDVMENYIQHDIDWKDIALEEERIKEEEELEVIAEAENKIKNEKLADAVKEMQDPKTIAKELIKLRNQFKSIFFLIFYFFRRQKFKY